MIRLTILIVLLVINAGAEYSEKALLEGINLILDQQYAMSINKADSLIEESPLSPSGYFLKSMIFEARMVDYEKTGDEEVFLETTGKCIETCKRIIDSGNAGAETYFFAGAAKAVISAHKFRFSEYFEGTGNFLKADKYLDKSLEINPEFYDSFFFKSLYSFAKEKFFSIFALPFLSKKEVPGSVKLMETCADSGKYTAGFARLALISMYTSSGFPEKAVAAAEKFLRSHKENRAALWMLSDAYEAMGKDKKMINTVERLIASTEKIPEGSPYNLAALHLRAINYYLKRDNKRKALEHKEKALLLRDAPGCGKREKKLLEEISDREILL
ncbi:MAG: tetratricopeptide repeat protein [Fibrobacterota bacterium]